MTREGRAPIKEKPHFEKKNIYEGAGGLWQPPLPTIQPQQQFFIFPCVKRKESKERWEWRLNLSLNIYIEIYIQLKGASVFLIFSLTFAKTTDVSVNQPEVVVVGLKWQPHTGVGTDLVPSRQSCIVRLLRDRDASDSLEREGA